jgi:flagellar hook-associated protein 3 FlgL
MRVTSNNFPDNLVNNLQLLSRRQFSLQNQIASGQRLHEASDDPLAAQQVLGLRDDSVRVAQYQKNIETHSEFATATYGTIRSLKSVFDRAQEIAFSVDGLDSPEDLKSYATEITELIKQAVQVANSQHRGEYLLAGTQSATQPFSLTTDATGQVTAVTFQANVSLPESEIGSGVVVSSRVAGENTSGSGERGLLADSRFGADLFAHLITLQNQLASGDTAGIQTTTREQLGNDEENLLYHIANNGALQSRLEVSLNSAKDHDLSIEKEISQHADLDLAEAIVRLNQQQTSYQAALQSAGSMLDLNLLSFLR